MELNSWLWQASTVPLSTVSEFKVHIQCESELYRQPEKQELSKKSKYGCDGRFKAMQICSEDRQLCYIQMCRNKQNLFKSWKYFIL